MKYIKDNFFHGLIGLRENNGAKMLQGLKVISDEIRCTKSQLALAWVIKNKNASTAMFGANRNGHIHDNIGALKELMRMLIRGLKDFKKYAGS